jgi:hypothetical protein
MVVDELPGAIFLDEEVGGSKGRTRDKLAAKDDGDLAEEYDGRAAGHDARLIRISQDPRPAFHDSFAAS